MDRKTWNEITRNIEAPLEGDGYHVAVWLVTGTVWQGAWRYVPGTLDVIAIEREKRNHVYIPLSAIVAVKKVEP
jgi:hypothetical protein